MRLHELLESDDSQNKTIETDLLRYFDINLPYSMTRSFQPMASEYSINNGYVSVNWECRLIHPTAELPIKFHSVGGSFTCNGMGLTSLNGSPTTVGMDFICNNNKLKSLLGGPKNIGRRLDIRRNPLQSLEGLPNFKKDDYIKTEILLSYRAKLGMLKLLYVKNLSKIIVVGNKDIENILNKYLGKDRTGAIQCAAELTRAGFKGNARL